MLTPITDYLERSQFATVIIAVGLIIVATSSILLASHVSDLIASVFSIYVGLLTAYAASRLRARYRRRLDRFFWKAFAPQDRFDMWRRDRAVQMQREVAQTTQRIIDLETEIQRLRTQLDLRERELHRSKKDSELE